MLNSFLKNGVGVKMYEFVVVVVFPNSFQWVSIYYLWVGPPEYGVTGRPMNGVFHV